MTKILRYNPTMLHQGKLVEGLYFDKVADLFIAYGFDVIPAGTFDNSNPYEIGLNMRGMEEAERMKNIAEVTGVHMPPKFDTPQEILATSLPIVAKLESGSRGMFKFLLRTYEQKIRFLTSVLISGKKFNTLSKIADPKKACIDYRNRVEQGDFLDLHTNSGEFFRYFVFEEYCETRSDYYTSYRIVADPYGEIFYGLLLHSDEKKGKAFIKENTRVNFLSTPFDLFTNPASPLFIKSEKIVSNTSEGGKAILLNGRCVTNKLERKICDDHNIHPDAPHIPEALMHPSLLIGAACRIDYPHIGIDWLPVKNGEHLFLEANMGADISPEYIGLNPKKHTHGDSSLELMRRTLEKI